MTQVVPSGVERKVDVLGRVVIPSEMRQVLRIADGDYVRIDLRDGSIVLSPLSAQCPVCGSRLPAS